MNNTWFRRFGWAYIPTHFIGFLITIICLALDVFFFMAIDRNSHSASDTLIHFFVYFTCVAFWWKWIAQKTS